MAEADTHDVELAIQDSEESPVGGTPKSPVMSPGGYTAAMNDAKTAYKKGDAQASASAHAKKLENEEEHSKAGDHIKSVVFGGLDGIITTFSVVAGASGGSLSVGVILILGFSNLFSDGLSMGLGDALSTKAENEHILNERKRESWEMETNPEGEIEEMIEIYVQRGMSKEDAAAAIGLMSKYHEFFINVMMAEELGLMVPDEDDNPWFSGFITFCSFVFFGLWPLLGYLVVPNDAGQEAQFICAIVLTLIMLFLLGAIKAQFSVRAWYWSGLETVGMGGIAAGSAFFIGWFVRVVAMGGQVSEGGCSLLLSA